MTEDHWSNNPRFKKTSMNSEDEEFNRMEREASLRKAAVRETVSKRKWIGLTDEEVLSIGKELGLKCKLGGNPNIDFDYARAIEDLLRKKNT
jgi:hypothetical protein